MSADAAVAEGRPGAGELLAAQMETAAEGRRRRRDLKPLARLGPYIRAHAGDALASGLFLILSTAATLGLTQGMRMIADEGIAGRTLAAVDRTFLIGAAIAITLAIPT